MEGKVSSMKLISLFIFSSVFTSVVQAKEVGVVYRNNVAVGKVLRERVLDAYGEFISLLAHSPFDPTLQFNVGSTLSLIGEPDKAVELYKQLLLQVEELRKKPGLDEATLRELGAVRFGALYNLGVQYQSVQDIDNALTNYQLALELVPDSKEIKTNIEMLLGQGGGKGKNKDKKDDKGDGDGEGKDQDQKDGKDPKDEKKDSKEQKKQGKKQFDQKQMSMEDLKRIMEELKQQEQGIRAKFQGKGGQNENKEKEW
jgi:Ca-activated chloride channel homolog